MLNSKFYALLLQSQGFKNEALQIYNNLLLKNPDDLELKREIKNLTTKKYFKVSNPIKLKEFEEINQKNRYEFEKWLSGF